MKNTKQSGFGVVAALIAVVLLAAVAYAGYRVYQSNHDKETSSKVTATPTATAAPVENSDDVDKATKQLDDSDLDKNLDTSSLDADISAVL